MRSVLSALALIVATEPALAADEPRIVTHVAVETRDLDLSTAAGQRAFDRRVRIAVNRACGSLASRDVATRADLRACRVAAWTGTERHKAALIAKAATAGSQRLSAH